MTFPVPIFFQPVDTSDTTYTFCPPIRGYTEPWAATTPVKDRPFLSHFRGAPRAVNVYQLLDGSFSEEEGLRPEEYIRVFRGATCVTVDEETATMLVAAGYTVEESDG